MKCPFCNSTHSRVVDKRDNENSIRRRRECLDCKKRYTTHEMIENNQLTVIKKDNTRRPFDRIKIKNGLIKACEKRPVSIEQIDDLTDKIEANIRSKGLAEIDSKEIGEVIMSALKKTDKIAYIRFASVYKEFAAIDDFKNAINKL